MNCHGSFATAGCIMCKTKANADEIREEIMNGGIPRCKLCNSDEAFMKPGMQDVVGLLVLTKHRYCIFWRTTSGSFW